MLKVLITTDFSEDSHCLFRYVLSAFPSKDYSYLLCHNNSRYSSKEILISIDDIVDSTVARKLNQEVDILKKLSGEELDVSVISESAELPRSIEECCRQHEIDIVVLGIKDEKLLGTRINVDSGTFRNLLESIPATVLLVPVDEELKHPKSVLFATRLNSIRNKSDVQPLLSFSESCGAHIDVLNVGLEIPFTSDRPSLLEDQVNGYFNGHDITLHAIQESEPYRTIREFAELKQSDMICLIYRKHGFIERLIRESISSRLISTSRIPLLMLKIGKMKIA